LPVFYEPGDTGGLQCGYSSGRLQAFLSSGSVFSVIPVDRLEQPRKARAGVTGERCHGLFVGVQGCRVTVPPGVSHFSQLPSQSVVEKLTGFDDLARGCLCTAAPRGNEINV
jgi:hypothetical protein